MEENKKTTLRTIVREYVVNKIIDGDLTSGMKINESKICLDLNMSKSPVREAISELVSDGILMNEDFKGTSVASFENKDIIELTAMRSALEIMAADFAVAHLSDEARNTLLEVTKRMKVAAEKNDVRMMADLDMEYHFNIILLSDNKTLVETWQRIYNKLRIHIYKKNIMYGDLKQQCHDHEKLIEYFKLETLYLFKQMLTEHLYFYLKK